MIFFNCIQSEVVQKLRISNRRSDKRQRKNRKFLKSLMRPLGSLTSKITYRNLQLAVRNYNQLNFLCIEVHDKNFERSQMHGTQTSIYYEHELSIQPNFVHIHVSFLCVCVCKCEFNPDSITNLIMAKLLKIT